MTKSGKVGVASVVAVLLAALAAGGPASAQDPAIAPTTALSDGGRTVSDGVRSLSISQATDLDPNGQAINVAGSGFPADKGIYVAFCVIPPTNQRPTPCGGGVDKEAVSGASLWVSSNAPDYGSGLVVPYGPNGSFSGTINVSPAINSTLDCRQVRCAVVTRTDHTRSTDRSLDLFLPVTFGAASTQGSATTVAPPPPSTTTTLPALTAAMVAPVATVSPDGRAVSDGQRELGADVVADLDPAGAPVVLTGSGFDPDRGIYVGLCAVPAGDASLPAGAAAAPGPCSAPAEGGSVWISSNPPAYGVGVAVPFEEGGRFARTVTVRPEIDATHDCRAIACALVARNDDTNGADRTQDLYLPVTFAASSAEAARVEEAGAGGSSAASSADPDGPTVMVAGGVLGLAVVVGALAWRRRRRSADSVASAS